MNIISIYDRANEVTNEMVVRPRALQIALKNKVTLGDCLDYVRDARAKGLTAPVVLMGYLNPFLAYGLDKLMKDAQEAGERREDVFLASLRVRSSLTQKLDRCLSTLWFENGRKK